jgi:zinc protease
MQSTPFHRTILRNGLTVISHFDKAGARNEAPERTGFAHLFEHLMFGGSMNAPHFDTVLQQAGGNNNAFTNNDFTNYYDILPVDNLESALWLEADRMGQLDINERSLAIQKSVVVEEFKENYLNQPYGNAWHLLRGMAYKHHPYRWPTIGLEPRHVEEAQLDDVTAFYRHYYHPANAIMVIAGGIPTDKAFELANRYFGELPTGHVPDVAWQQEPPQIAPRELEYKDHVPLNALYRAYHMGARTEQAYYEADLLTDVLSSGPSSRLYQRLVKQQQLFTTLYAHVTANLDPGLLVIHGRLNPGVAFEAAEAALDAELEQLVHTPVSQTELEKVHNKVESGFAYNTVNLMNRAFSLAYFEMLGDAAGLDREPERFLRVSASDLQQHAAKVFRKENSSTLRYIASTHHTPTA